MWACQLAPSTSVIVAVLAFYYRAIVATGLMSSRITGELPSFRARLVKSLSLIIYLLFILCTVCQDQIPCNIPMITIDDLFLINHLCHRTSLIEFACILVAPDARPVERERLRMQATGSNLVYLCLNSPHYFTAAHHRLHKRS